MNHHSTFQLTAACASLLLSATLMAGNAQADDAEQTSPLQFYTGENGSYAKVTLEANLGFFTQDNSWFGKSEDNLGKKSDSWWESLIRPGLEASFTLPSTQTLYGRIDAAAVERPKLSGSAYFRRRSVLSTPRTSSRATGSMPGWATTTSICSLAPGWNFRMVQ